MITREQVADLQRGDVVELHRQGWAEDVVVRGTVLGDTCNGELYLGDYQLTSATSLAPEWLKFPETTLSVVSRAPRPLYVNHPRTEPVPGDVVRKDGDDGPWMAFYDTHGCWVDRKRYSVHPTVMPERLRLLVDGETGQVVP